MLRHFKGSETILIARFKLAVGTFFTVAASMDPTPFLALLNIDTKWAPVWQLFSAWLMADGLMSEWARRRNATDLQ